MNWASFLIGLVKPILGQILAALGLAVVTYAGSSAVLDQVRQYMQTSMSQMPSTAASLMGMAGLGDAIGIILGAGVYRMSMAAFKKLDFKLK